MLKYISNVKNYFENKKWIWKEDENFIIFNKMYTQKKQTVQHKNFDICNLINLFKEKTYIFFKKNFQSLHKEVALDIFNSYEENAFVGAGLEIYHEYFYKDKNLPKIPSIIFQPSIRIGNALTNTQKSHSYLYSSLSFLNVSIIDFFTLPYEEYLDLMISYISSFGVFADRITFSIDKNIKNHNKILNSLTTRFYVDDIEVGDVLIYEKINKEIFVEFGIGFERLVSQILKCKYKELFDESNHELAILQNCLVFLSMNNLKNANRGARSKISLIVKNIKEFNNIDSYKQCKKHYNYWKAITDNQITFDETMENFERIIYENII